MNWDQLILLLKIAGCLWLVYFWSCFCGWMEFSCWVWDPPEAKAKGVLTAGISLGIIALWAHWTIAVVFFIAAFVAYFKAKKRFRRR